MVDEAYTRDVVKKWAKKVGLKHVRMSLMPGARVGVPDDHFIVPSAATGLAFGVQVFIEFKTTGKRPSEIQNERLKELQDAGIFADWFDDADAAIGFLVKVVGAFTLYAQGGRPPDVSICRRPTSATGGAKNEHISRGVLSPARTRARVYNARHRAAARRPPDMA